MTKQKKKDFVACYWKQNMCGMMSRQTPGIDKTRVKCLPVHVRHFLALRDSLICIANLSYGGHEISRKKLHVRCTCCTTYAKIWTCERAFLFGLAGVKENFFCFLYNFLINFNCKFAKWTQIKRLSEFQFRLHIVEGAHGSVKSARTANNCKSIFGVAKVKIVSQKTYLSWAVVKAIVEAVDFRWFSSRRIWFVDGDLTKWTVDLNDILRALCDFLFADGSTSEQKDK